ncbi:MAG: fumarylacetoacetate hydrolase family protein [Tatlockia sp.]|nr:fumarylacetoacetate hydrolase family protein [Tatlockia sp.]
MKKVYLIGSPEGINISNIFCIGRNYAAHNSELGNKNEDQPLVFLKPTSALNTQNIINLPQISNEIDYETELVLLIGKKGKKLKKEEALAVISGYGLGLDLTARDLQAEAKKKGLPWTIAKGFDNAASVSAFIPAAEIPDPLMLNFQMKLNGKIRQQACIDEMLFELPYLISYLSTQFTLEVGDLIFTGTPAGTGRINIGDLIELNLADKLEMVFTIN